MVHVNRLQPHVRREGNGIQNLNQSLIRTDRNKTTETNNSPIHYRSLGNVTEKNHTLQEANNTSIRMDSSLRDRSTDDIVPIDSQLQLTTDSDYSFVNSTPMKMTASTPLRMINQVNS